MQLSLTVNSRVCGCHLSPGIASLTVYSGDIAHTMDKLTTRALQAQVEAAVRETQPNCHLLSVPDIPFSHTEC